MYMVQEVGSLREEGRCSGLKGVNHVHRKAHLFTLAWDISFIHHRDNTQCHRQMDRQSDDSIMPIANRTACSIQYNRLKIKSMLIKL